MADALLSRASVIVGSDEAIERREMCIRDRKEAIPYVISGREDYLSEEPVRRVLAFFRVLDRPGDTASLRVLLRAAGTADAAGVLEAYAKGKPKIPELADLLAYTDPALSLIHIWMVCLELAQQRFAAFSLRGRFVQPARPVRLLQR